MGRKVLILVHPLTIPKEVGRWAIHGLSQVWVKTGIEVAYLQGISAAPPADVLIVHIDLSVVPDEFLKFAERYPVAINARVKDIRKRSISNQRVLAGDAWQGPVIVKSDLNCCGLGELMLHVRAPHQLGKPKYPFKLERQTDYPIFDSLAQVPKEYFDNEDLIVERFLPEREGDLYFVRSHHFLGSKATTVRLGSRRPIVLGQTAEVIQTIDVDEGVLLVREELGLQYGKIDYVVHEGRVVVLDVNKTTGDGGMSTNASVMEMRRHRASGIYDFLPQ